MAGMNLNSRIDLGQETENVVENEVIKTMTWNTRYAERLSVSNREQYLAKSANLQPDYIFEVITAEFDEEKDTRVRCPSGTSGKVYEIIASQDKGNGRTHLTVSRLPEEEEEVE